MTDVQLISVQGIKYPIVPVPFAGKDCSVSTESFLQLCQKPVIHTRVWLHVWILYAVPLICYQDQRKWLISVITWFFFLDYCSLESNTTSPPTRPFLQVALFLPDPSHFQANVRLSFLFSTRKPWWDFDWDCVESRYQLEENWHLNDIAPLTSEHSKFLHLIRSSSIYFRNALQFFSPCVLYTSCHMCL